jgi:hypothetical protein
MSNSEDVKTLFRRFGGQPETYQEVVRERQAETSLGKWAMLGQVDLEHVQAIPSAHRVIQTAATRPYSESLAEAMLEPVPAARVATVQRPPAPTRPAVAPIVAQAAPQRKPVPAPAPVMEARPVVSRKKPVPPAKPALPPSKPAAAPSATLPKPPPPSRTPSPLAARLKTPVSLVAPGTAEASSVSSKTLSGLFGRLAQSAPQPSPAGVFKRKFNK